MPEFIKNTARDVKASVARFVFPFGLTVVLFILASYTIIAEPVGGVADVVFRLVLTSAFAFLVCTLGKILAPALPMFAQLGLLALSAAAYFPLGNFDEDPYITAGYFGVMFALFVAVVYFSTKKDISLNFSYIFKNTVFNCVCCGIVNSGVALCIVAFNALIHELDDIFKVVLVSGSFIWIVLFMNLSLAAIPQDGGELTIPRLFKIIVMYVALPVYLLLIAILCAYLGKVLVTFTFPSGQINWFASFASLFFVFFVFSVRQYRHENRFAGYFVKYGGWALMPIIAVQFMAISIRLSNYGLTTPRYVSVVFNAIAFIFAAVSLIKDGKYIKYMLPVLGAAALVLTLTPLNLFDVPARDQTARLEAVLTRNGMLVNGEIIPKADIPPDDQLAITSAWKYLEYNNEGKRPDILAGLEATRFDEIFGFRQKYESNLYAETAPSWEYVYYHDLHYGDDISGFSKLYTVHGAGVYNSDEDNDAIGFMISGTRIPFDFISEAKRLYGLYGPDASGASMTYELESGRLLLTSFDFRVSADETMINSYEGYFLEK